MFTRRFLCLLVSIALVAVPVSPSSAEDIDLFTQPKNTGANNRPNILLVIDNTSNWSAANQGWAGGIKQGQSELNALRRIVSESDDNVNIGLMMLASGTGSGGSGRDGGYIRFHVRQMTAANKAALIELIGTDSCVDGPNSLNGTPNCIYKNFAGGEQVSTATADYSATLFEAYKYFGGYTSPANALTNVAGSPLAADKFGATRYSGNPDSKYDAAAYSGDKLSYNPPINADNSCTSNHIILVGNGFPNSDAPATLLSGVGGSTVQLKMPAAISTSPPTPDAFPASNRVRYADEWAKFLFETDVNSAQGQQNVRVYTVDVFKDQQDLDQTRLLKSMARAGGDIGQYHEAKSEEQIVAALKKIIIDIQSVNSVFTSATVPVTAANRVQQENEIYFGSFVPDHEARPRWYGNLKKYQAKMFGNDVRLADKNGNQALIGGAFDACSVSFWTTDNLDNSRVNGGYWAFDVNAKGLCPEGTHNTSVYSDLPDSGFTRKGGAAEVLRRGNDPAAATLTTNVNRTLYTCASSDTCPTGTTGRVSFDATNVAASRLGTALTAAQHTNIINHTIGQDVNDENQNANITEARSTIHGDVVHSRVVPVNYGGTTGVVLYYGSNDGPFRAVSGKDGKELWGFIAPEHHGKLKRLADNSPLVLYAGMSTTGFAVTPTPKDYFFDGPAGLYQNADNSKVMIYPTMRRGGRMLYAMDVTNPTDPQLKWRVGCDETGTCTPGFDEIGQTWSAPNIARVGGHLSGTSPIIVMGGGYDACEDTDSATPNCSSAKGRIVYVIDAITGEQLKSFSTVTTGSGTGPAGRSVPADVAFVDRNGDGMVDHAYVADTGGNLFRIDFVDPTTLQARAKSLWEMTKIAYTQGANRKFLQAPGVLATKTKVFIAIGSGDRERPLRSNYPYTQDVQNRFYMFIDKFPATSSVPVNLDDTDKLANFTTTTNCDTTVNTNSLGWFMGINNSQGEQTVSSALIFGGLIFFNTNAPSPPTLNQCGADLGQARGYAINLLNASGAIGATGICGGGRFGLFVGGGLPPTPVAAVLPIGADGKPELVLIGAANLDGTGGSVPQGAQRPRPPVQSKRNRVYWYKQGNF